MAALLKRELTVLAREVDLVPNEATLGHRFLNAVGSFLATANLTERGVKLVLESRLVSGRADARIGSVFFEFKLPHPRGSGLQGAIAQLSGYLEQARSRGERVRGVGYDGREIAILEADGSVIARGPAARTATALESLLILIGGRIASPQDFVARLGLEAPAAREAIGHLHDIFQEYRPRVGFVDEVYKVWETLYGTGANLSDAARDGIARTGQGLGLSVRSEGQALQLLFVLQTYLSVLLRLMLARVAVEQRVVRATALHELIGQRPAIELGDLDRKLPAYEGVFEHDTFLWFVEAAHRSPDVENTLNGDLSRLAEVVDDIDFLGSGIDFLREVYWRFFDRSTRQALGEFYTRQELVDEVLDLVGYDGDPAAKVVDVSCGSGTFLVRAIARVKARAQERGLSRQATLDAIVASVVGIDIHPFAVAMARVNYLLSVSDLIDAARAGDKPLRVPVFWADSLGRLTRGLPGLGSPVEVDVPGVGTYHMPNPEDVDWDLLLSTVKTSIDSSPGRVEAPVVLAHVREAVGAAAFSQYEGTLSEFVDAMVSRHSEGRDMRWVPLLRNVLVVDSLRSRCDFVVGNPPWVRIGHLSSSLRSRLRRGYSFVRFAGWSRGCELSGARRQFGKNIDLCVAFVQRALELLRPDGRLGYVITSKVMHTLYANRLRQHLVTDTSLLGLIDYSLHKYPLFEEATNYPLLFAAQKTPPPPGHLVPIKVINGRGEFSVFSLPQHDLSLLVGDMESPWLLCPPDVVAAFRKAQRHPLAGSTPRFRPRMGIMTQRNNLFYCVSIRPSERPGEVVVETEGGETLRIEKDMLRPLVRGRNVSGPHGATCDSWMLWTHGTVDLEPLPSLPPLANAYFLSHRDEMVSRSDYRDGPMWRLFRVDASKLGGKVLWPDISPRMKARAVGGRVEDAVLGHVPLVPDKSVFLIPTSDEASAAGLCRLLNSLFGQVYLTSFAQRLRNGYFHFTSSVVALLPIPEALILGTAQTTMDVPRKKAGAFDDSDVMVALGLQARDWHALQAFWSFVEAGGGAADQPLAEDVNDETEASPEHD